MKTLALFVFFVFFVTGCTTTTITRTSPDGESNFTASNTSIGWERENVTLEVIKTEEGLGVRVGIGKSGGAEGLKKAIKSLEDGLLALKGLKP